MTRFLIIVSILYVSFAVYSFQGVKTLFKASWVQWLYVLILAFALGYFILKINTYSPGSAMKTSVADIMLSITPPKVYLQEENL